MGEKDTIKQIREKRAEWEKKVYSKAVQENPERKQKFKNLSEVEIKHKDRLKKVFRNFGIRMKLKKVKITKVL